MIMAAGTRGESGVGGNGLFTIASFSSVGWRDQLHFMPIRIGHYRSPAPFAVGRWMHNQSASLHEPVQIGINSIDTESDPDASRFT